MQKALPPQAGLCAQKIMIVGAIHESSLRVRRNDDVEAQRRRWTFYETLKLREKITPVLQISQTNKIQMKSH